MERNLKCQYCQKVFTAKSTKAQYCSNTCKTYAYQERRGTLQTNIKDATIKGINDRKDEEKAANQNLKPVASYLTNLFIQMGTSQDDTECKVKNVTIQKKGNFLLASTHYNVIEELQQRFDGCKIFEGATEQTNRQAKRTPTPNYQFELKRYNEIKDKQIAEEQMHGYSTIAELPHPIPEYETEYDMDYDTVFYTVVTLEKVLQVSKLPKEAIE